MSGGGGGGKGGESKQSIDPRLSAASAEALTRAGEASKIPYSPNRGVTIADFTDQQKAAMANASNAATAFGLEGGVAPTKPEAETSASGIRGFSTGADFDEMIKKSLSPALQAAIDKMFINRTTGAGFGGATAQGGAAKKGLSGWDMMMNTMGGGLRGTPQPKSMAEGK